MNTIQPDLAALGEACGGLDTWHEFMAVVGQRRVECDGEVTYLASPAPVFKIKGRCVHVRCTLSFAELAQDLLGNGKPCEEFSLRGQDLCARLKTEAQIVADIAAREADEKHGEFTWRDAGAGLSITMTNWDDLATPARKGAPKKERERGPVYTAIAACVAKSKETTFNRYDLVGAAKVLLGPKVRTDSIVRTLNTQVVGTLLEVVPNTDGEELTLKDEA